MNLEQSEEFEKIQQILIDGLDQCLWVRIIGKKPNQTYLDVQMQRIENREQQTNFMNCGIFCPVKKYPEYVKARLFPLAEVS